MGDDYKAVDQGSSSSSLKKRCSGSMTAAALGGINDCLNDDLLLQILCTLPLQSALACTSVCKRWLSLISTHHFLTSFLSRHHHRQRNCLLPKGEWSYFLLSSQQIPKFNISLTSKYDVLASSDDLLLIRSGLPHNATYFICNPFNKGWLKLPPPPPASTHYPCFGFTCERYYRVTDDRQQQVMVNSSCRFRVVRLKPTAIRNHRSAQATSAFEADVFSCETWQWTTTMMHTPLKVQPIRSTSRNGLLYWMCFSGEVVVHDPFSNAVCYAIHPPRDELCSLGFRFSVSEGSLLAFQRPVGWDFKVWELEDWDQREWRLRTAVALKDHILNTSEMVEWAEAGHGPLGTLAFDPSDKNVFFLNKCVGEIATIDLRTRLFKPEFLPKLSLQRYDFITSPNSGRTTLFEHAPPVLEIKAPCYPTPISAIFNQAPAWLTY